jgi:2-enoate reductase
MKLFEPGRIGGLEIKNRILMAPMGIGGLAEPDGRLSQRAIEFYTARAQGGVGMIITGFTCVDVEIEKKAEKGFGVFARADLPIHINRLSELADAVHDYGTKLCVQLTAGMGRVAYGDVVTQGHTVAPSPSPCFWNPRYKARELTTEEVEGLVRAFGRAAGYLRFAGVDAIQLHGHEGYLFDQFQSALWNQRTDKYGGDLEGRLRFPLEVIEIIKSKLGRDFPVIYRYGLMHHMEGGRELEESLEMARRFEAAGADALEADAGCYETWYWAHPPTYQPPGCMVDMASAAKQVVNIPVISVGKLGYPDLAENVLEEGKVDFICLGRALLADPDWPRKVKARQLEDIRPCIGDHAGCLGRIFQGKYLSCAVNPSVGMEKAFTLKPSEDSKSVLVIGGGPAGMQAAIVATRRGHRVSLWERKERLGGNLIPASVPDFKKDLLAFLKYLTNQVGKHSIEVRLGKEATSNDIKIAAPDVVIAATGASPLIPDIPGLHRKPVYTPVDLYLNRQEAGDRVLVIGGGLVGCETALYLSQQGCSVKVVEVLDRICLGENKANLQHLVKLLDDHHVEVLTNASVLEVAERGAVVNHHGKTKALTIDTIVAATGLAPNPSFREELGDLITEVYAVGDCVQPRRIMEAIWGGFRIASLI